MDVNKIREFELLIKEFVKSEYGDVEDLDISYIEPIPDDLGYILYGECLYFNFKDYINDTIYVNVNFCVYFDGDIKIDFHFNEKLTEKFKPFIRKRKLNNIENEII